MKKNPICIYIYVYIYYWAFLVAQSVKNLPAVQETRVWFLGWEDPLEKEMATYSSILAWQVSWTEEPGGLQYVGSQRVRHDWATNTHLLTIFIIMQCICLVGFPGGSDGKESACSAGDPGQEDPLEKGTATNSSILAWRIPWTEESGGLI